MRQPRTWPESPTPGPHPMSSCRAPHTSVMSVGTRATLPDRTGANVSPAERGCGVRIDLRRQNVTRPPAPPAERVARSAREIWCRRGEYDDAKQPESACGDTE